MFSRPQQLFFSYDRWTSSMFQKEKVNKRKNCNSWACASLQYLKKRMCATAWRAAIFTVSALVSCPTGRTKGAVWCCWFCVFQILQEGGTQPRVQQTLAFSTALCSMTLKTRTNRSINGQKRAYSLRGLASTWSAHLFYLQKWNLFLP